MQSVAAALVRLWQGRQVPLLRDVLAAMATPPLSRPDAAAALAWAVVERGGGAAVAEVSAAALAAGQVGAAALVLEDLADLAMPSPHFIKVGSVVWGVSVCMGMVRARACVAVVGREGGGHAGVLHSVPAAAAACTSSLQRQPCVQPAHELKNCPPCPEHCCASCPRRPWRSPPQVAGDVIVHAVHAGHAQQVVEAMSVLLEDGYSSLLSDVAADLVGRGGLCCCGLMVGGRSRPAKHLHHCILGLPCVAGQWGRRFTLPPDQLCCSLRHAVHVCSLAAQPPTAAVLLCCLLRRLPPQHCTPGAAGPGTTTRMQGTARSWVR